MDVSLSYKIRMNPKEILAKIRPKVMRLVETAVKNTVDNYLKDLEAHLGTIPGATGYTDSEVSWEKLDLEADEAGNKFWYRSGGVARSVVVNIRVSDDGVRVFAGVPKGSASYNKALWNELGFTPADGDGLIRRPVFMPLAENHIEELVRRLRELTNKMQLRVTVT